MKDLQHLNPCILMITALHQPWSFKLFIYDSRRVVSSLVSSCRVPPFDVRSNRRSTCSTSFIDGRTEGCSPVQITASVNTSSASSTWLDWSLIPSSRRSTDKPFPLSWYCFHDHCAKLYYSPPSFASRPVMSSRRTTPKL